MSTIEEKLNQASNHFSHPSHMFTPLIFFTDLSLLNDYLNLTLSTLLTAIPLYFITSTLLYLLYHHIFKSTFAPRHLQLRYQPQSFSFDIKWSLLNILGQVPFISLIRLGYPYLSKVQYQWEFTSMTVVYLLLHISFDEFMTYWAHRLLHHPSIYKQIHSVHHQTKAITSFTGFAFHPLDAFIQAVPVFTSCYFIPIHINIVLAHAAMTSLWAFSIHDNINLVPFKGILYAGSHSIHHFPWGVNYNYGKFTSVCDRLYGTYCDPEGITGFGYTSPQKWQGFMNTLNRWYCKLIPDQGAQSIGQIRTLHSTKSQ